MTLINEDRLEARINKWSGGSVLLVAAVALAVGFALHALFF